MGNPEYFPKGKIGGRKRARRAKSPASADDEEVPPYEDDDCVDGADNSDDMECQECES